MRRLVLICMMLLLPLQWSWAAAAVYCAHETGAVAPHPGHHVHEHQADDGEAAKAPATAKTAVDSDCHVCHLSSLPVLGEEAAPIPPDQSAPPRFDYRACASSHIPPGPERPDRLRAA